jgi:hypothetical protein
LDGSSSEEENEEQKALKEKDPEGDLEVSQKSWETSN